MQSLYVSNFAFCPIKAMLAVIRPIKKVPTIHMQRGVEIHQKVSEEEKKKNFYTISEKTLRMPFPKFLDILSYNRKASHIIQNLKNRYEGIIEKFSFPVSFQEIFIAGRMDVFQGGKIIEVKTTGGNTSRKLQEYVGKNQLYIYSIIFSFKEMDGNLENILKNRIHIELRLIDSGNEKILKSYEKKDMVKKYINLVNKHIDIFLKKSSVHPNCNICEYYEFCHNSKV